MQFFIDINIISNVFYFNRFWYVFKGIRGLAQTRTFLLLRTKKKTIFFATVHYLGKSNTDIHCKLLHAIDIKGKLKIRN